MSCNVHNLIIIYGAILKQIKKVKTLQIFNRDHFYVEQASISVNWDDIIKLIIENDLEIETMTLLIAKINLNLNQENYSKPLPKFKSLELRGDILDRGAFESLYKFLSTSQGKESAKLNINKIHCSTPEKFKSILEIIYTIPEKYKVWISILCGFIKKVCFYDVT